MKRMLDLRSDTVTRPDQAMREAMRNAEVGDAVMGDDPTVLQLEKMGAELFGKEACLMTVSGTMSNQTAVLSMTGRGEQIIVHDRSHMYNLEVAGLSVISGVQPRPLPAPEGKYDLQTLEENMIGTAIQTAPTTLICMENTFDLNRGLAIEKNYIDQVCRLAHSHGVPVYMDGARILNAAVALDEKPDVLCEEVDAVSLCLSKGLGCPVGSLLAGSAEMIGKARRMCQMLGGGWRQGGILAAAGIVGLGRWRELEEDQRRARSLAGGLARLGLQIDCDQVQTNVIRVELGSLGLGSREFCQALSGFGVLAKPIETGALRMICHRDIGDEDIPAVLAAVEDCLNSLDR
ncbi:threonine aldolase family protein [Bacilliculturomica massiliensis]|uniref:threonine aldolase family protein n=1 Tax=Bacilliculturomica massiliensis TaxID=1917867 RepID=UPI0010319026|nr:GntG family PLP-dependent aldolase [Bacilliculturomica massiliensis]